jgi:hypothetical protein
MPETYTLQIDGGTLRRGFWIYVWEAITGNGEKLLYVGRTGDNSTPNAQSPFNRMGQHLGNTKNSSMLRNHLDKRGVVPEECQFRLVAHGPSFDEVANNDMDAHMQVRDVVGALEKKLADELKAASYEVMNNVNCTWPRDEALYAQVRPAFAAEFENL